MREALDAVFPDFRQDWNFEEQVGRSPRVTNLPSEIHVNLSHSKGIICFAISDMPIGVDIEACERQRDFYALSKMFMNDSERERLAAMNEPSAFFYRCWCVKEAYYKAQPLAEQENLHFTGIALDDIDNSDIDWYLTEGKVGEYYLAAASLNRPRQITCHYFPSESPWQTPFTQAAGKMPASG